MSALFLILLAFSGPLLAADADGLIGTWNLVSWQVVVDNEPRRKTFSGLTQRVFSS
jgi:hypothetical protein